MKMPNAGPRVFGLLPCRPMEGTGAYHDDVLQGMPVLGVHQELRNIPVST